jgi:hypothetical protein
VIPFFTRQASGHQPLFPETEKTVFPDDDMIMDKDVQDLCRLLNRLCESDIRI